MSLDASRRPHLAARIATSLALTAIAAAVLACTPPRDNAPATPQSTIAVTAVLSAA
jgi:hypothetical protein